MLTPCSKLLLRRAPILKIAALALLAGAALRPGAAHALCLSSETGLSNCASFEPGSASQVETFGFADANLATNRFFRLSLSYAGATPVTVNNVSYSLNNGGSWATYDGGSLGSGSNGSFGAPGAEVASASAFGPNQLRFRLTIPSGTPLNTAQPPANNALLTLRLVAGDSSGPSGNLTTASRTFSPQAGAPGPVPLLGAAMALRISRRLRRRIRHAA
jgi:hypothetical protein